MKPKQNTLYREQRQKEIEEDFKKIVITPGTIHLKDQHRDKFRKPDCQGVFEALIPICVYYTVANYNGYWLLYFNVLILYFIFLF